MDENNRLPMDEISEETEAIEQKEINENTQEEPENKPAYSRAREIYEWISSIAIAVVLALVINQFFFAFVQVDGQSMEPTLYHNERLVV